MIKKIIAVALVFCIVIPSFSSAVYKDANKNDANTINEMENHNCLVFGIGFFPDEGSAGDMIIKFMLFLLEHIIIITDVVLFTVMLIYILISNNIPGMKMPHLRYMMAYGALGYVWTYRLEEKWAVWSRDTGKSFYMLMENFTGIWLQLPTIIKPIGYPFFCMDVFIGYTGGIEIWWEEG